MNFMLELKLATTQIYFLEEMFRHCRNFQRQPRANASISTIEVAVTRPERNVVRTELPYFNRMVLQELTQDEHATWLFVFHMDDAERDPGNNTAGEPRMSAPDTHEHYPHAEEPSEFAERATLFRDISQPEKSSPVLVLGLPAVSWYELWSCTLTDIGGTYPLLVSLHSARPLFYAFTRQILARCGLLWDAQVVSHSTATHDLYQLLDSDDVPKNAWLDQLERTVWGTAYERWAPRNRRKNDDSSLPITQSTTEDTPLTAQASSSEMQNAEGAATSRVSAPVEDGAIATPPVTPLNASPMPVATIPIGESVPTTDTEHRTTPTIPSTPLHRTVKAHGDTAEKLERLRQLFADKQRVRRRRLSWSAACVEAKIDPKTAEVHAPELKAEWIALIESLKNPSGK